jgi:tyrosine-protein phosphatase YwqE
MSSIGSEKELREVKGCLFSSFKRKKQKYSFDFEAIGVDMHAHLIPGVDDGPENLEDAIALVRDLKKLGFKKIITTPHVYQDYYPNTSDQLLAGLDTLRKGLGAANIDIEVECAAEYYMDEVFESLLDKKELLTFGGNHVLVEMSFFQEAIKLDEYLFQMRIAEYQPVLAHPERYTYYATNFERFQNIKDRGCKLQLNLLSLRGYYGKEVKDLAIKLLNHNLYDFVGTDTHNSGHIEELKTMKAKQGRGANGIENKFFNNTL